MTGRTPCPLATTPGRRETPADATTGKETVTMTRPGHPHPDYERPGDTRPGRDNPEGPFLRAILFIFFAYAAIAIPLVALRLVWQFSPLAAVAAATLAALYIIQKVSNR